MAGFSEAPDFIPSQEMTLGSIVFGKIITSMEEARSSSWKEAINFPALVHLLSKPEMTPPMVRNPPSSSSGNTRNRETADAGTAGSYAG